MSSKHGSSNAYNKGCHCEECRTAHRKRMRDVRAELAARPRSEVPHGTRGGYSNWGCRCTPCTTASTEDNREACRRYAAKKRAERKARADEQR